MTTTTRFPSERGPRLVPRLVREWRTDCFHICMARVELPHDAIVTLQALCGDWGYGLLLHADIREIAERYPGFGTCPDCLEHWKALTS